MSEQRIGLTEGLVVAGIPAAGYWFAYLYELGYCRYFDIPAAFIEISVQEVLVAIAGLCGALGTIVVLSSPLFMLSRSWPKPIRRSMASITIPTLILMGFSLLFHQSTLALISELVVFVGIVAYEFAVPLLTQKEAAGYLDKLEAEDNARRKIDSLFDVIAKSVGRVPFLLFVGVFLLSYIAYFAGGYEAKTKMYFMVLRSTTEKVVLKKTNDNFLAAQFDRASKKLTSKFSVISSSAQEVFEFEFDVVGPLVPAQIK